MRDFKFPRRYWWRPKCRCVAPCRLVSCYRHVLRA